MHFLPQRFLFCFVFRVDNNYRDRKDFKKVDKYLGWAVNAHLLMVPIVAVVSNTKGKFDE